MRLLTEFDIDGFLSRLAAATHRVLFLDYEGTLAPDHPRAEFARPHPGVRQALDRVMRDPGTQVAVISARRPQALRALLDLARPPDIWGADGWERLTPQQRFWTRPIAAPLLDALERGAAIAASLPGPGVRMEVKPASVAVHWLGMPLLRAEAVRQRLRESWLPLAAAGLDLIHTRDGLTLRAAGDARCDAVSTVIAEAPPRAVFAYLGDGAEDEVVFDAMGGRGLMVRVADDARRSRAHAWLRPPRELVRFIERWAGEEIPA